MKVLQDVVTNGRKSYVPTATDEEAQEGTSDTVLMTPASTKEAIETLATRSSNLDGGLSNSVYTTGTEIDGGDSNGS